MSKENAIAYLLMADEEAQRFESYPEWGAKPESIDYWDIISWVREALRELQED